MERKEQLFQRIAKVRPNWLEDRQKEEAENLILHLSPQLTPCLMQWAETGEEPDYTAGQFSLHKIQEICNVDYLRAFWLLDVYLRDPKIGVALILDQNPRKVF